MEKSDFIARRHRIVRLRNSRDSSGLGPALRYTEPCGWESDLANSSNMYTARREYVSLRPRRALRATGADLPSVCEKRHVSPILVTQPPRLISSRAKCRAAVFARTLRSPRCASDSVFMGRKCGSMAAAGMGEWPGVASGADSPPFSRLTISRGLRVELGEPRWGKILKFLQREFFWIVETKT